ncbi:hypothetical protein ACQP2Y_21260 [Actinoplanes sp. CA-051413]|uniref:hypothetical protein n=1 Tax=Actinoplanes sp. CA-051413 TaxID=3239899 RepID=UPI003D9741CA
MSGYQYTYPADTSYLNGLPQHQQDLARDLLRQSAETGADLADLLAAADVPAEDKAALTEVWK